VRRRPLLGLLLLALAAGAGWWEQQRPSAPPQPPAQQHRDSDIEGAIRDRTSARVEASATVTKLLADDREGSRHQRFLVALPTGHRILIAHNIDLASRAPVRVGDTVRFRGLFEWNERGGVVHWTHHDPEHRGRDGWLELDGRRFE